MKHITVIIPCYNEAESIGAVIAAFPREKLLRYGLELEILVVDNNSKDNTATLAAAAGARVITELRQGKGHAIRAGFDAISSATDYVVMLDGDDTYRPEEIMRLIEPIDSGFCNVVIGSRLAGHISDGSMRPFNRLGNWMFSHLVRYAYQVNVTDVLTGYFAWSRAAVMQLRPHLESEGFAIEMEMITKMARLGQAIYSVPISYHSRLGESSLSPIGDGSRILAMYLSNLKWLPETSTAVHAGAAGATSVAGHQRWNRSGNRRATNFYESLDTRTHHSRKSGARP
ncbi:glycosyltransferase [bacterium]|nr:MAG: glycosyltransferase [bacterium]